MRTTGILLLVTGLTIPGAARAQEEPATDPGNSATDTAPATPDAAEVQALEDDMEAAKKKIEAAGVEEIAATPVDTAAPADSAATEKPAASVEDDRPASVRLAEGGAADRAFGALVVLDHTLGVGTFVRDATLRGSRAYVAQSWDLRPTYKFEAFGHKLKAGARFLFELELTTPDSNPARRFKPSDISVYLLDNNIYTEPLTGVTFTGVARWFLPTSWESVNVTNRYSALALGAGANRTFGPVYLEYGFSFTKNLNSTKGLQTPTDVPLHSFAGAGRRGDALPLEVGDSYDNGLNKSFRLTNSFAVTYNFDEHLSASYSLALLNDFRYTQDNVNVVDELSSPFADAGRGRTDSLWPTLDVTYVLDDLVAKVYPLPFSLMASVGLTALHPAQTRDNGNLIWPFFYQALGTNRAANNYASFYLDLVGVY